MIETIKTWASNKYQLKMLTSGSFIEKGRRAPFKMI